MLITASFAIQYAGNKLLTENETHNLYTVENMQIASQIPDSFVNYVLSL
jgi:hypothetical protein